jgi:two-component system CheB/CheR fusion protein
LGRGSQFEVRLPLAESEKPEQLVKRPSPAKDHDDRELQRIVIVEDQDDNRAMLARLLEMDGFTVHAAASGREGLDLVQRERPDAAIIDIGLPEMDGYEVAQRIRSADGDHIRLIALTGYGQSRDVEQARAAGFDHHLVKPLQLDRLIGLLRNQSPAAEKLT